MKRVLQWLLRSVIALLALSTIAGLVLASRNFEVASTGVAADYWEYLCGVQLPGFTGHNTYSYSGGVRPEVDGLLYYYEQHHHEKQLFVVSSAEVLGALPLTREHLQSDRPPDRGACTDDYRSNCAVYEAAAPKRALCREHLAENASPQVTPADLERIRVRVEDAREREYRQHNDEEFRERIVRAERVWLTFAFEAVFLAAWLSFVAWPLFARSRVRWYLRAGLAPFLLFLPYFLGYAPMTFTFGPSGGFVYPGYLLLADIPMELIPCSPADAYIWQLLPQVLAPLSQVPGSPTAATYFGCVGPASSLFFGIALILVVSAASWGWSKIRRHHAVS